MATKLINRSRLRERIAEAKLDNADPEDIEQIYIEYYINYFRQHCNDDDLIRYAQNYGIDYEEAPE